MFYKIIIPLLIVFLLETKGIFTGYYISGLSIVRLIELVLFLFIIKYFWNNINNNKLLQFFMKLKQYV